MKLFGRYLLRQIIVYLLAMTLVTLLALMLERTLRLLGLLGGSNEIIGYLTPMLLNLIPHYLGIAMPAALLLSVLLTFNRMNRDGELVAMHNAGVGLQHMARPVLGLTIVLLLFVAVVFSYLQPLGRYGYRSVVHAVAHQSLAAAVRDGTFIQADGLTFMIEPIDPSSAETAGIFVFEEKNDGSHDVTVANRGTLSRAADGNGTILTLEGGQRVSFPAEDAPASSLAFNTLRWQVGTDIEQRFRDRGEDERELTLTELFAALDLPPAGISPYQVSAELNGRLIRILTILFLPLLAIPLALGGGRRGQSYGIVVGVAILVLYQQALQFGEGLTEQGTVSAQFGMWPLFFIYLVGTVILFLRAAYRVTGDPYSGIAVLSDRVAGALAQVAERLRTSDRSAT
jgi:lipopolysaccharide export system permease protein